MTNQLANKIDHTLLKPESTEEDILQICQEAKDHDFAAVCIQPYWVPSANQALQGTKVDIATVIGFPLGVTSTFTKIAETRDAIASGATEIDMVINLGALKSHQDTIVVWDINQVVEAAKGQALVKVIIETGYLSEDEKRRACILATEAGADFVKTSTGFGPGAATIEDVALMRKTIGEDMEVKASGGVRDRETAEAMVEAGASRIGASAGIAIVSGEAGNEAY
ncbi:MAG TPA: deoxyribose-phosphate aldolase [Pseudogracilibacillus sp.]|nr:deoxyribose-phosphate aldolase [Pseudogracilibacillus sp.]